MDHTWSDNDNISNFLGVLGFPYSRSGYGPSAEMENFEVFQNMLNHIPIDAKFYADFKNV